MEEQFDYFGIKGCVRWQENRAGAWTWSYVVPSAGLEGASTETYESDFLAHAAALRAVHYEIERVVGDAR